MSVAFTRNYHYKHCQPVTKAQKYTLMTVFFFSILFFILILCCLITCSVHAYLFHVNYHILIQNARSHTLLGMIALVVNAFNDDVFTILEKRLWHVTIQFVGCDLIAPFNHCYDRLSAWWLTAFDGFSPSYHSYVEIGPEPNNTIVFVNNGLSTNF